MASICPKPKPPTARVRGLGKIHQEQVVCYQASFRPAVTA
jgi:hypothetical protein